MTTNQTNGITPKGKGWEWAQSFWIIFSLVPFLSGMGFLYIALRTKRVKWAIWGLVYELPLLLYALTEKAAVDSWQSNVAFLALILSVILATIHAFVARKEFLLRLYALKTQAVKQEEMMKYSIGKEYGVDMGDTEQTTAKAKQPAEAVANVEAATPAPPLAPTEEPLQIVESLLARVEPIVTEPYPLDGTPPPPEAAAPTYMTPPPVPQAAPSISEVAATTPVQSPPPLPLATGDGLVDLNHASEEAIAALPGIGLIYAKRAVSEREAIGGFQSLEQFGQTMGFRPHVLERIRPLVTLTPLRKESPSKAGRVVDV